MGFNSSKVFQGEIFYKKIVGQSEPEYSIIHDPFSSLKMSHVVHLVEHSWHFMEFNDHHKKHFSIRKP